MPKLLSTLRRGLVALLSLGAASASAQPQSWRPGEPVPSAKEIFGGSLSPEADQFLTSSNVEFNQKQASLHSGWLRDQKRFDIDMDRAVLRVQKANSSVYFDVQFVGSHEKQRNTWEWAWNNPGVPRALTAASLKARAVGEQFGLRYVTAGMIPVPDGRFPWFVGGLVAKASGAIGVFCAPSGGLDYYFVLFNPREATP